MKALSVAVGIVLRQGNVLIAQRRPNDSFGGFWEFPGGKVEPGETPSQCVVRELLEEVGLDVRPFGTLTPVCQNYPTVILTLHPFVCSSDEAEARPIAASQVRWVTPDALGAYKFPPASAPIIAEFLSTLTRWR